MHISTFINNMQCIKLLNEANEREIVSKQIKHEVKKGTVFICVKKIKDKRTKPCKQKQKRRNRQNIQKNKY